MNTATILSVCECQARLGADLDETRCVIHGWAREPRRKRERSAPAHTISGKKAQFQVAWFCPFCGRNTTRSFDTDGLAWREEANANANANANAAGASSAG